MEIENTFNVTFIAEIELVYKTKVKASDRPQVKSAKDCYNILLKTWDENKIEFIEQFKIVLLNRSNRILGILEISSGGITATIVDPRLIFVAALKAKATSLILTHNHPSGNVQPTREDENLTQKLRQAGEFLEISVVDHLIISKEKYYSFADEGAL